MNKIIAFLSTSYGAIAAVIAAIGVIWGGVKTGREIRKWVSEGLQRHRERQSVPEKTLAMVQRIQEDQSEKDEQQKLWMAEVTRRLDGFEKRFDAVDQSIGGVDSQVGTLQNEKLVWAYVHYGVERHEISLGTRTSLELMFDQYVNTGKHNHVPQDFKAVIRLAPLKEAVD